MIYFVECDLIPHIKIGYTRDRMAGRLKEIRGSLPVRLSVLTTVLGTQPQEQACHRALGRFRKDGEWFSRKEALEFRDDCLELSVEGALDKWNGRLRVEIERQQQRVAEATQQVRPALLQIIESAILAYGLERVCQVMRCHPTSIFQWRKRATPELHRVLNLLTLDDHILDPLLDVYGMELRPLIPRLTAIVHEAEGLKAA